MSPRGKKLYICLWQEKLYINIYSNIQINNCVNIFVSVSVVVASVPFVSGVY